MAPARGRCEACGASLPTAAVRCPACGHHQGDAVTVEIGHGRHFGSRRGLVAVAAIAAVIVGALVFVGRDSGSKPAVAVEPTTSTTRTTIRRTTTTTGTTTTTAPTTTTTPQLQLGEPSGIRLIAGFESGA